MIHKTGNPVSFAENDERVDRLINSLQVGVLLQGPETNILYNNKAALDMLGLTEDQLYGKSSLHPEWSVFQEDGSPFSGPAYPVPVLLTAKKTAAHAIMGVSRPSTKDRIWLLVNTEPHLDEGGNILEVICSFSDITEHKKAEEKLTWLYQSLEVKALELATSNAELERFAYVATHDLQEPLRMVSSFMQLLKKKYEKNLDEQAGEYIRYAVEGANRMKKLIQDLVEFSRVSSSREEFAPTDLNEAFKNASGAFLKDIEETGAAISKPVLPVINANSPLIIQLFQNLIGNALKYRSHCRPDIQLDYTEKEDHYIFSIKDNGIGIDPQYSNKVFVLFQRLHNKNHTYEGTGVGLAICKKIVELHGGHIWVMAEPGAGSTFHFTIAKKPKLNV